MLFLLITICFNALFLYIYTMSDNQKDIYIKDPAIREGLLKGKMYRIFAYIFFAVGFLVFIMLYSGYMGGRPMKDMLSFAMIFIIIIPFLPCAALSLIAKKTEIAANKALEEYIEEEERKKQEKLKAIEEAKAAAAAAAAEAAGEDGEVSVPTEAEQAPAVAEKAEEKSS